jgi:hypothetical protein
VRSLLGELTPCEGKGQLAALSLKKDWFLRREVKRWTMKDFVDVAVVGAVDAVTASTASGAAGVVYASAVAAAAVDRSHVSRSRRSRWLRGLLIVYCRTTYSPCLPSRPGVCLLARGGPGHVRTGAKRGIRCHHISGADDSSAVTCLIRPTIYGPGLRIHTLPGPRFLKATAVLALASLGRGSATFVVEVREQFIGNSSLLASVGTLINAAGLTSAAPLWKDRRGGEKHQRTVVYNSSEGWR